MTTDTGTSREDALEREPTVGAVRAASPGLVRRTRKPRTAETVPASTPSTPPDIDTLFAEIDQEEELSDPEDARSAAYRDDKGLDAPFGLECYTRDAQALWLGRAWTEDKHGILGIEWMMGKSGGICRCAAVLDDPYAMMRLLKIEGMLSDIYGRIRITREKIERAYEALAADGIKVGEPSLDKFTPVIYPVHPHNGYAYTAMRLVGRWDKTLRDALQARDVRALDKSDLDYLQNRSPFRAVVNEVRTFQPSGTTRTDFLTENQRARDAVGKFGPVDAGVLDGSAVFKLIDIAPAVGGVSSRAEASEEDAVS